MSRFERRRRFLTALPLVNIIVEISARYFGMTGIELRQSGTSRAAHARMLVFFLLRGATSLGPTDIGRAFGRNRATVIYGIREIEIWVRIDSMLQRDLLAIAKLVLEETKPKELAPMRVAGLLTAA